MDRHHHHANEVSARAAIAAIGVIWVLFAAGVYLPDVGRGFIKDDFRWVLDGAAALQHPVRVFSSGWDGNFFRPIVALSFGADHALYGLWARGYGLTNLALYAGCVVLVCAVLRQLGFSAVASAAGAFAWATNPSGLDMAVLWLSGRTSLLMTLFACAAMIAALRSHRAAACGLFALALFSKEDALPIPLIVVAVKMLEGRSRREWLLDLSAFVTVAGLYLLLRAGTGAINPANAPDFYRLTWSPSLIVQNTMHYIDRAATSTAVLAAVVTLVCRKTPPWRAFDKKMVLVALIWFVVGICITVRIPVRSSLYVVFASVGAAILFATMLEAMRSSDANSNLERYVLAVFALVLLLVPVYGVRNDRWVEPARVSSRTLNALNRSPALPRAHAIVFQDEPNRFSNLRSSIGGVEEPALRLFFGRNISGRVIPADESSVGADLAVQLEGGAVIVRSTATNR